MRAVHGEGTTTTRRFVIPADPVDNDREAEAMVPDADSPGQLWSAFVDVFEFARARSSGKRRD